MNNDECECEVIPQNLELELSRKIRTKVIHNKAKGLNKEVCNSKVTFYDLSVYVLFHEKCTYS